jgi:hypothetical protein
VYRFARARNRLRRESHEGITGSKLIQTLVERHITRLIV